MRNEYAVDLVSPFDANEATGLIILSVGAPGLCTVSTAVQIQRFDKPYNAKAVAYLFIDSFMLDSEFADHHGHLYVEKLAPGKYYLSPYLIGGSYSNLFKADFEVRANENTYLGEYYMPKSCEVVSIMELRDQEARDLSSSNRRIPPLEMSQ